jgi:uncharacterized membrane protein
VSIGSGSADNDTARIEAFSDGVFAIAITLLVIEIGVPHVEGTGTTLFGALIEQWPSYLGYAISFLQIGVIWANHHNRFRYITRSDHLLLFLNTLFLMCVAFIPFPTALVAEYLQGSGAERTVAGAVYAGTLTVTAVFFTLLWLYAAANYRLVGQKSRPLPPTGLDAPLRARNGRLPRHLRACVRQRRRQPRPDSHPRPALRSARARRTK